MLKVSTCAKLTARFLDKCNYGPHCWDVFLRNFNLCECMHLKKLWKKHQKRI